MRSASAIYNNIRTLDSAWYEWRVTHGNNNYGLDTLKRISVSYSLASGSGISIGNANATKCEMTFLESSMNWERMAKFTVQFKIHAGTSQTVSEWITLGTFYTDERSEDKYGNLSIVAYDAMLMMEQYWTDKIPEQLLPASYPITAKAWATMIQSAGLATFADLTQLDDTIEFVGLDTTTTIRDVLKTIAAAHGGNWVMTPGETLKLIQFENVSSGYSTLGLSTKTLESSPALDAVTGVHLETSAGTVMESGDDDGYVVKAICDVSDTAGIAELCLSRLEDYVFRPFEAGTAYLDPIVEIGDSVSIDGTIYQVMAIEWYVQKTPTATVYAPYDQEIDHEYTIPSEQAKAYRKTMSAVAEQMEDYVPWDEVSTAIEQNAESVVIAASGTYVTQTEYDAAIADIQNQLDGNIQSWSGNVVPTLNNAPAVDWTTTALKNDHVGDMYFINSDAGIPEAGSYYRFENNNGTYSWQLITDSLATEALAQAAAALAAAEDAQDTADAAEAEAQLKGRIFVVQPTPPYAVGDLWFNSDQSEILTCMTARETGSFVAADWVKRNKYTDDSAFEAFQTLYNATITAIQDQIDQKAETYYQPNDPSLLWGAHPVGVAIVGIDVVGIPSAIAAEHTGDLWYRTTDGRTFYWDGEQWIEETVSDEVFDKIDGKAQVFINTPYTPYNVGDLWFNSASSEIMTCVTSRETGSFVQGDWQKRNKYTDDSALTSFVNATYNPTIAAIQADLDGKIDTYFYSYEPTLSNVPASQWSTTALKEEHLDDLFYNTTTGYTYRFTKSGSTYSWVRVKDSDITSAMQAASDAQDTADGKRRVFVSQPTDDQEYDVGDLWVNATYGSTYTNDILKCKTAKASGTEFSISHWEKASKYTDDSSFNAFVNSVYTPEISAIQSELDGKVDTYFYAYAPTLSNIPASQWNTDELREEHVDDLFFDTVSGYTYRFKKDGSTYSWERVKDSDITAAMTAASTAQDTADGKRRVFVSQPTNAQAYDVGDLWVNATYGSTYSNDLLRCKTAKAAGTAFNISHWEKASKYTDDSAANAVAEELTQFESSFSVEPSQINAEITKRVIKDHSETKTTFGWEMTDTYHKWYADNSEVVRINSNGVYVKGEIRATTGYIGNDSYGFEINATNFHNGMTSLSDTTHNGVYVGTDGIALGQGKFKVTSSGAVTASNLAITGGSIKLGGTDQSPVFNVTSSGAVTASNITINGGSITIRDGNNNVIFSANSSGVTVNGNGTFTGTVYAGNIVSAATQAGAGYFNGAGITAGSIYGGGASGQIAQNTLGDYNVAKSGGAGAYTTASFSSGVQGSLYNADRFGYATQRGSASYPEYFCATSITALSSMYANEFYIELGNDRQLALKTHYHTVTVSQDGTVQFGQPTTERPDPFNVADTKKYQDDVKAITVTSLDIEYTYDDEMHIYRLVGKAKNQAGTVVYQSTAGQWNTDRSAYVDGKADGADEVTVTSITRTYPDGESSYPYYDSPTLGKIIEFKAQAAMSNGHGDSAILTVPADAAYNAGYEAGSQGGSGSVTVTSLGFDPNDPVSYSATVNNYYVPIKAVLSNTVTRTTTLTVPATEAYNAGSTAGAAGVTITAITRTYPDGESSYPYYDSPTLGKVIEFKAQASMSNGQGGSQTLTVPATSAYNAGASDAENGVTVAVTTSETGWSNIWKKTISINAVAKNANGETLDSATPTIEVSALQAYSKGADDGASTAYVSNVTTGSAGLPSYNSEDQVYYANVSITATARGTKADGTYYTNDRTVTRAVNVSTVYTTAKSLGINEGAQTAYVSAITTGAAGTPSYSSEDQVYYAIVPITATARGTKSDGSYYTADRTINSAVDVTTVYNTGKTTGENSVTATAQSMTTSSSDYGTYDQSIGYGSSSLYTVSGSQYGRIKIKLSNNVERVVRISMPAGGSASVSSITVSSHSDTDDDIIWGEQQFFLKTNVAAYTSGSSTPIFSDTTGNVTCDITTAAMYFWNLGYPDHFAALDTDSSNYGTYDVSLNLGLTGKSYVTGTQNPQRYGRVGVYNNRDSLLKTVRVYMPATGASGVQISNVEGLSTDSSNYREYDFPASFYSGSVYTYGSSQYSRVRVTLSNNVQQVIRVATPASGSGGSITITRGEYPAGTYYNENGYTIKYYKYNSSGGFVKADAVCGSASNSGDIDVTDLVQAFYNMGRSAGGGGSYSYYWSDEKSGPYGSKQRDCYFTVNGSIVQTAKVIWSSGNPSFQ